MKEKTFNVFVFVSEGVIRWFGMAVHEQAGTDAEKTKALQRWVESDWKTCRKFPLPDRVMMTQGGKMIPGRFGYPAFAELVRVGQSAQIFEEAFQELGAPQNPLMVITPVVDGKVRIDGFTTF